MANYGWIVTIDHTVNNDRDASDVGKFGPKTIKPDVEAKLKAGEGERWRVFNDDGEMYYEGRYLGPDNGLMFRPLEDFAEPNAGATTIEYMTADGMWQAL